MSEPATLRYVILRHEMPAGAERASHWDLMLERAGVLRTWALEAEPGEHRTIPALALPDHRLDYLTYEGPVSGGRGDVRRYDEGHYAIEQEGAGRLVVRLEGRRLQGQATLTADAPLDQRWTFSFVADSRSA
jgi:hypothetical protein